MAFRCVVLSLIMVVSFAHRAFATEPIESDVLADIGHCGAVYAVSAAAATDEATRAAFKKHQKRMNDLVTQELGSDDELIKRAASQSLAEMFKDARSKNEATGAADLLVKRQAFCADLQQRLPK